MQGMLTVIVIFKLLAIVTICHGQAHRRFLEWSTPIHLPPPINTEFDDHSAVLSKDERTMFFTSTRTGSIENSEDIWVSKRKNRNADWETPVRLSNAINTDRMERVRSISADGRILLFQSNRTGNADIWAVVRKNPNDDFGWSSPINLGPTINTRADELAAHYVFRNDNGTHKLFFSSARTDIGGLGFADIYASDINSAGEFETPVNVTILNSPSTETCLWVRDDGLEIIFSSNRPNQTGDRNFFDLWVSTREGVDQAWSTPQNLGPTINVAGYQDVNPVLSSDNRTMLFASRRPGGIGDGTLDIYMSTRRPVRSDQ
jgi:Tol biopolymer transport system component